MRTARGQQPAGSGGRGIALAAIAALVLSGCAPLGESTAWDPVPARGLHLWPAGAVLAVDVSHLDSQEARAVFLAFDEWLDRASVSLDVREALPGEAPHVIFRNVEEVEEGHESMGLTRLHWSGNRLMLAEVELARTTRCGSALSREERRRTLLHEIGHVLGLGHSQRFSSIMYWNTPGVRVDDADRASLALLYGVQPVRAVVAATRDD